MALSTFGRIGEAAFAHHPLNSYFAVANDLRELTELLK